MKSIAFAVLLLFLTTSPCFANMIIYDVQFSDGSGVYIGTNDIIKCTVIRGIKYEDEVNSKQAPVTYLVDLANNMVKTFKVEGKTPARDNTYWGKIDSDLRKTVFEYVRDNYAYVYNQSISREQMAYEVE